MKISNYSSSDAYDEMFGSNGDPRSSNATFVDKLSRLPDGTLQRRQNEAELSLQKMGITFNVYGHEAGTEKVWPFDLLPRIIDAAEWETVSSGLRQRLEALNLFITDVYNDQKIFKDKVVPADLILGSKTYRKQCEGFTPAEGVWCHITGVDLIRHSDGQIYVLEDNLRCPSGVSYVLENRELMKRTLPGVFEGMSVEPIEDYPEQLLNTLLDCAPTGRDPTAVVLTPGVYNSAYFEHTFLARQMGIELVQGSDLVVRDGYVYMNTTRGLEKVDVIYRRIDDDFLDPDCFRADSVLGVRGLMESWRAGKVTLANAPGTGIADDKAVYSYVPKIIKYYLGQDAILPNVPTFLCSESADRSHVLSNLESLVVKPTNESGGKGLMIGPRSTKEERDEAARQIESNPREWIAQPTLTLSTVPTLIDGEVKPRHVDLRPFVLYGKEIYVMPGGLTRVALPEGSLVVNSSQGGGSKDTWVLKSSSEKMSPHFETSQTENADA